MRAVDEQKMAKGYDRPNEVRIATLTFITDLNNTKTLTGIL